ncbi:unnamed protein product [Caenorhabditis angaria]|uniref:Uncharacterized protein n=1 Tax=Caenorhabditis angaria TaxID=860376 RepID=A0A9P1II34_9PELO|nr:unnamed protein product [Caenorhabditis angaria]
MEVDSGSSSSSEDEIEQKLIHTANVRLAMDDSKSAEIIANTIKVDKEPSRSGAVRKVTFEEHFVVLEIVSSDPKSLSKSISNAVDMCDLSQKTLRLAQKYPSPENGVKRPFSE